MPIPIPASAPIPGGLAPFRLNGRPSDALQCQSLSICVIDDEEEAIESSACAYDVEGREKWCSWQS